MVGAGFLMAFVMLVALFVWLRKKFQVKSGWWQLLTLSIILPYLANTTGWLLTELGRQPWVVYGLMKTEDAVSPTVPASYVMTSLAVFTLIYGLLIVVDVYLLARFTKAGPDVEHLDSQVVKAG